MKNFSELKNFRKDIPGIFNEACILKNQLDRFEIATNYGEIIPPYEILIHPSGVCNLRCQWCIGGNIPTNVKNVNNNLKYLPSKLINPDNMEKLIRDILSYEKTIKINKCGRRVSKKFKVERIQFSGIVGEPLIAKDSIIRAIRMLTKTGVKVGIFTNGTLIDDDIIGEFIKISYVNISLDAGTPESYAKMKYGGRKEGKLIFLKVLDNIRKLIAARNNHKENELKVNASYVLYPDNYNGIYKAAKILKEIGVSTLRMKQDNSGKNLLSQKQIKEADALISKIEELKDENFDFVKIHILNNPSEMRRTHGKCIITDLMAAIGCDGNVYPCNYHPRVGGLTYGDAIENDFKSIWESKKRATIKGMLPSGCPSVCDPFKNRANRLFKEICDYQKKKGKKETEALISNLVNSIK